MVCDNAGPLKADEIEKILCHKFMGFMMMRAENFFILRRKAVEVREISIFKKPGVCNACLQCCPFANCFAVI